MPYSLFNKINRSSKTLRFKYQLCFIRDLNQNIPKTADNAHDRVSNTI